MAGEQHVDLVALEEPARELLELGVVELRFCDDNIIGIGGLPEQQFSTLISWMMEKFGKKAYTIAADYNFGQILSEWTRKLVEDNRDEVVGQELIPLGVSQFGQTHPGGRSR